MTTDAQQDLFGGSTATTKRPQKRRDVDAEALARLEKVGYRTWSKDLLTMVAAKIIAEHFPEYKKLLVIALSLQAGNTQKHISS